jgi:peroxiredoxin/dienelactone hydrolase
MKALISLPLLYLSLCLQAQAAVQIDFDADSGNSYTISHQQGQGKTLLLWLPSEFGLGEGYRKVVEQLAMRGIDVWALNLHESLMIPTGRGSLDNVSHSDMQALIALARDRGFDQLFISGSGRGAALALRMSHRWQAREGQDEFVRGLIMFSPQFFEGRTPPGQRPAMIPLSAYSNLPVYLIQPEYSTRYAHREAIRQRLSSGGSPVFAHYLSAVQDGFQARPDGDLTERDLAARARLPATLESAISLLQGMSKAPFVDFEEYQAPDDAKQMVSLKRFELHPHSGDPMPPSLRLPAMDNKTIDLQQLTGQVVLVNFWATWCGPCVREIPSLSRLVDRLRGRPFRVLAVNINEPKQEIRRFVQDMRINFDILLDADGQSVRDWNVYAYPSNFLIDSRGDIRYVYRGALEWDDDAIVNVIESMFLPINQGLVVNSLEPEGKNMR